MGTSDRTAFAARRADVWIPLAYAAVAGAWIAFSDLLLASVVPAEALTRWSIAKGAGFVVVTAALLHAGLRWVLALERRARRRIEESEALLRTITSAIPDPVFVKDRESRWLFGNPAALRVTGRAPEEVLGRSDREIYATPAIAEALIAVDRRVLERGVAEVVEEVIESPGGRLRFISTKVPLRDETGRVTGLVGIARDVTEQRRLEEELQQALRLESIGRLAGGVAHDFNNLLTVILSCTEELAREAEARRPADPELVAEIAGAGERAREVTRQLLAFARRQVIRPVPLDLNALLRGAERLLRRVLGEDVDIAARLEPGAWTVRADPGQLEQVVLNLAVNARDAMPGGGRLAIETANVEPGPELLAANPSVRPGRYVRLTIRDSGHGMTPEVKAHLFEPFFTTKAEGHGTGLGLATVYGIVRQSEGYVLVDSAPGRGTAFEVYLPATDASVAVPAPAPGPRRGGDEAVLVVEDDAQVREVTVRALRSGGYRVLVARDGGEALGLPDATLAGMRLLVTDVVMPGMGGRALAEALLARHAGLRVLYVSGYTPDAALQRGLLAPGTSFLAKPFTPSDLLARVRAELDAQPGAAGAG